MAMVGEIRRAGRVALGAFESSGVATANSDGGTIAQKHTSLLRSLAENNEGYPTN